MTEKPKTKYGFFSIMGCIFVGLILLGTVGAGWVAWQAASTAPHNIKTAETILRITSARWDVEDAMPLFASQIANLIDKGQAQQAFQKYRQLGALQVVETASQIQFLSNSNPTTGTTRTAVVELVGQFERGRARVTVFLLSDHGHMRLQRMNVDSVGAISKPTTKA